MVHVFRDFGRDLNSTASHSDDCHTFVLQIQTGVEIGRVAQRAFEVVEALDSGPFPITRKLN